MSFTVSGFVGGQSGSLTTFVGVGSPTSVAPVSTNDNIAVDSVSQQQGVNPVSSIGNGLNQSSLKLCVNTSGNQYWVQITGGSNYNASGQIGPFLQDCGS